MAVDGRQLNAVKVAGDLFVGERGSRCGHGRRSRVFASFYAAGISTYCARHVDVSSRYHMWVYIVVVVSMLPITDSVLLAV